MSATTTAMQLRSLLEAEAASFHPSLQAQPIPRMGGGMGIVATARIAPGATLARLPFRSMITVKKARLNLAMAEVALVCGRASFHSGVVPFTASPLSEEVVANALASAEAVEELRRKLSLLEQHLSGTDTVTCYLVLMAALYGRWHGEKEGQYCMEGGAGVCGASPSSRDPAKDVAAVPLCFTHENAWMGPWICGLPDCYDNLLEVGIQCGCAPPAEATAGTAGRPPLPSHKGIIDSALRYPRHRAKVYEEQADAWRRYRHCVALLRCLQCLPSGQLAGARAGGSGGGGSDPCMAGNSVLSPLGRPSSCCSLKQFLWAFNSLLSRGFAFEEDVWAMMPYVDYFNYALDANGTMSYRHLPSAVPQGTARRANLFRRGTRADDAFTFPEDYEYLFRTTRPVQPGEQVLLHYGAYSDFELLMWYGFTLSPFLRPSEPLPAQGEEGSAKARTPLSLLIRQLQNETLRRAIFEKQRGSPQADHEAPTHGNEDVDGSDKADEEWASWQLALQRAYSHVFTPLADTDGDYPVVREGTSWLGDLVDIFLAAVPSLATGGLTLTVEEAAMQDWAVFLASDWQTNAASRERLMTLKGLSATGHGGVAALGVLGPSSQMADTIRFLASHCLRGAYKQEKLDAAAERVAAVRALAWMEYFTRRSASTSVPFSSPSELAEGGDAEDRTWLVSAAAVSMAEGLSRDVDALLCYLSIEATDEELCDYLAREPSY